MINNTRCILHVRVIGLILFLLIIINLWRSHDLYDIVDLWNIFPKYILITVIKNNRCLMYFCIDIGLLKRLLIELSLTLYRWD